MKRVQTHKVVLMLFCLVEQLLTNVLALPILHWQQVHILFPFMLRVYLAQRSLKWDMLLLI